MKEIALIITLLVCQTTSGQQISLSNNRYRGNDAYNGGTVLLLYVLSTASVACNKRTVPLLQVFMRALVLIMISWICIIPCFGDNYLKGCWTLQSERSSVYSPNEGLGIICNDCPQIFFGDNGKGYYCFGDDGFTFSWEYCQGFLTISSEKSFLGNTGCQKFHVSISKTNINQKMILYRYHKENEKMDIFSLTNDELVISISKKINDRIDTDREMELAILKQLVPQDTYLSESDTIYILKGSVDNRSLFVESDSITHFMYERTIIHKVPESILNETHRFFVFSTLKRLVWEIVSSFNECSNQTFYRINQERSLNDLRIGF